jgi:hypothetical protein
MGEDTGDFHVAQMMEAPAISLHLKSLASNCFVGEFPRRVDAQLSAGGNFAHDGHGPVLVSETMATC